ncbi:Vitamin B12 transporter BtuB precursor [compost metagenome]
MNFQIKRERLLASTMIAGLALAGMAAPAMAQTTPAPAEADQASQVSDVVVTGSRIRQSNLTTTSPVTQVTGEDIDIAGVTRVEDLVNQLPQAFAAQNSTVSNGASGTATVSLRNLGADRTLVLVDGRRMGYGSPNDAAADLNQIPGQLVERVEVLTGGASAVYGSDAVAGVVNFITKKDFEGIQIDAQYGFYQHNNDYDGPGNLRAVIERRGQTNPSNFKLPDDNVVDGESREINLMMGVSAPDGKGNLLAYAGYRSNNPILGANRDYSSCSLGGEAAGEFTCGGSGTSFPGQFVALLPTGNKALTVGGPSTPGAGTFVPYSAATGAYNFGPLNYFQRPDERYTLGAMGRYQINDKVEAFAQLMFSDYKSNAQIAPSGAFLGPILEINCSNPLLSAQQRGEIGCAAPGDSVNMLIGRRNVEGGGRQDTINYESYRAVVGIRGEIAAGWNYDVAAQFSRVNMSRVYLNDFSNTRLARAFDVVDVGGVATCRSVVDGTDPACVPYNIFSLGGVTQEALDYLQIPLVQTGETTQQVLTAALTGDLGQYGWQLPTASSGVKVAIGAEYRRDALGSTTDVSFATGDGAGQGGPTIGFTGSADVIDAFGEIQIPLADEQPWAYSASVDAAYRHSEYARLSTDTYKFGIDYAPIEDVRFRASYARAVRAPNVIELFQAQGFNLFDMDDDPCDFTDPNGDGTASAAACIGTNPWQVTAAQSTGGLVTNPSGQYNFLQGGNPDLEPEESDTVTFGVVFTPSFLPRFNLTLDYFNIEVSNLIGAIGQLNTISACYDNNVAAACQLIRRDPGTGGLWLADGNVIDTNVNIGGLKTSGMDVNANYSIDLADLGADQWGRLGFGFVGTWLKELETDTGLGFSNSVYDCAGFFANQCGVPNPEWRHRARMTWETPWDVQFAGTWRYYSEVEIGVLGTDGSLNNSIDRLDKTLEAQNYFDIAADWQVRDNLSLRAGVNNVFDRDPPLSYSVGTTGNNNTYPQLYDAMGRYFFFGLTANF